MAKKIGVIVCSVLIVLGLVFCLFTKKKATTDSTEIVQNEIFDISWERKNGDDTEVIYFSKDGHFSYYDLSGNPVDDSDLCESYELKGDTIKLLCTGETPYDEIKILNISKSYIKLLINGKERKFNIHKDIRPFEIYKVGYLSGLRSNKVVLTNYDEFTKFIDNINKNNRVSKEFYKTMYDLYDKDTFEVSNILMYYVQTKSGSHKLKDVEVSVSNGKAYVTYDLEKPEVGTADMSGYMIVADLDKDVNFVE